MLSQLRSKIIYALAIGLVVVVALGLLSDVRQVGASLASFNWVEIPAILGFTLLNYLLRWLKWDYYLRRMRMGGNVSHATSGLLFTSGMVMAVTPGKVGEVLKSYLLRRLNGTPVTASAPIVFAERLTDGLAMLLLMAFGLTLYPAAVPAFAALLALTVLGIALLQSRALCERLLTWLGTLPVLSRFAPKLLALYDNTRALLDWRVMLVSTLLSVVSWFGECVALWFVLRGLGQPGTWLLLLQSTFIFAASTLFGLVSFLPGGLGVSEASSAGLLIGLVGMNAGAATTATIIIRFCTLWFGVALGALALWALNKRLGADPADAVAAA